MASAIACAPPAPGGRDGEEAMDARGGAASSTQARDPRFVATQPFSPEAARAAQGVLSLSRSPPATRSGSPAMKHWDIVLGDDKALQTSASGDGTSTSTVPSVPLTDASTTVQHAVSFAHPSHHGSHTPVYPATAAVAGHSQPPASSPACAPLTSYPPHVATGNASYTHAPTHGPPVYARASQPLTMPCTSGGMHPPGQVALPANAPPPSQYHHHPPAYTPVVPTPPGSVWTPIYRVEGRTPVTPWAPSRARPRTRRLITVPTRDEWTAVDSLLALSLPISKRPHTRQMPSPTLRRYTCAMCPSAFKRRYDLNQHVSAVHLKQQPFRCPECPKSFSHNGTMRKHVRTVHRKEKPFLCGYNGCNLRFSEKGNLNKHFSRKHGAGSGAVRL